MTIRVWRRKPPLPPCFRRLWVSKREIDDNRQIVGLWLKSLIGDRIFTVLNIEKICSSTCPPFCTVRQCIFVLCCGIHYSLRTCWKTLFFPKRQALRRQIGCWYEKKGNNGRQASILKSVATTSSPISSTKSALFLYVFIRFSARKPAREPLYPDCVPSVFPHAM